MVAAAKRRKNAEMLSRHAAKFTFKEHMTFIHSWAQIILYQKHSAKYAVQFFLILKRSVTSEMNFLIQLKRNAILQLRNDIFVLS